MSVLIQCHCIYVEIRNENDPRSGCIEYRAQSCEACETRAAILRADTNSVVAFEPAAPRYQRMMH